MNQKNFEASNSTGEINKILKILLLILIANLIGAILVALLSTGAEIFNDKTLELILDKAVHKVHIPFGKLLLSSILCNFIVSTGVCLAYSCREEISKVVVVWLAITVFVLSQTEHVVANMYYLFLAFFNGADITLLQIFYSLSVAALGNFIGGGIIVSGANYLLAFRDIEKNIKPENSEVEE